MAETNENEETVSMSKADYDKAIQSAEDKLRTKYSKEIKDLQDKVTELTPKEKSEAELDFEKRLAEVTSKEKRLTLMDTLTSKGIDKGMVDFIRDDADIESFEKAITNMVNQRLIATGYSPVNHKPSETISADKWSKMSYSEKSAFYNANPELAKKFMSK